MTEEIKKLIEEEAEKHIGINVVFGCAPIETHEGFRKRAFIDGASFILHQNRWRKVEEELPDPDIAVLCRMKSPNVIVEGFIYKHNGIAKIETQPDFEFEDYADGEVIEWKPIS